MPAGAGTAGAVNSYLTPFIVRSPSTSVPSNSALRVSRNRDVMSILPSVWLPKNQASSSVPLHAYAAMSAPSTEMPMVIVLPSAAFMSATYRADCGNADSVAVVVAGAASDVEVASVEVPPEQADRVPSATSALTPTSRVRKCFLM